MRAQLLHLSGPHRGKTITYIEPRLLLGTSPDAHIRYPAGLFENVVENHAEITFVEEGCSFYLKAIEGQVFVNRQEVKEVILERDDLIEIGLGGPKARFRIHHTPGHVCKPVHLMLSDAREVGGESGLFASTYSLRRDLLVHSTLRVKLGLLVLGIAGAFGAAFLGGVISGTRASREHEQMRERQARAYESQLGAIHDELDEFSRRQAGNASREELEGLRADLARRASVVDRLVERNAALARVLNVYSRGVCLLHGVYTFEIQAGDQTIPVAGPDGQPLALEYIGSGFLASPEGHVVTNRHVAEPWWNNEAVGPLLAQGMIPRFVHLSAGFPGGAPIEVDPATIRLSPDELDVAVLQVQPPAGVPVLPLHAGKIEALRGGRVVLLGYPTGLNALLARSEPDLVEEVLAAATDTESLIAELAARDAISPVITQGALNEVKERRLVYDAETTSGGSGGPVFGPDGTVIGVNFAITRDFDGSNFGIPIEFARKLLP
jgi:S1-C subfamily serine protease